MYLRDVPNMQFRTWNEPFMNAMEKWVRYIARQLHERKLLAPKGGPVILIQLENEYKMVSDAYGTDGHKYLQWVADLQKELCFGVPSIMCYGAAEGVLETINAFYAHEHVEEHRELHPDQPPIWTECWTGWYDVFGAPHHRRPAQDLLYAVARFVACGGAGINYYMWHGGTNFGRVGMYLQATSYDYDAPVDEFGFETAKMQALKRFHAAVKSCWGAASERVSKGVWKRGNRLFICNDTDDYTDDFVLPDGNYYDELHPKSVEVVDADSLELLFGTMDVREYAVKRERVELDVDMSEWRHVHERVPSLDGDFGKRACVTAANPVDLLSLTKNESDYAFYLARYKSSCSGTQKLKVTFEAADVAYVYMDGVRMAASMQPPWEDRWPNKWNEYPDGFRGTKHEFALDFDIGAEVEVCVMCVSMGMIKGDWQLRPGMNMLDERKGLLSDLEITSSGTVLKRCTEWRCVGGLEGETTLPMQIPELWQCDNVAEGDAVPGLHACRIDAEKVSMSWPAESQCDKVTRAVGLPGWQGCRVDAEKVSISWPGQQQGDKLAGGDGVPGLRGCQIDAEKVSVSWPVQRRDEKVTDGVPGWYGCRIDAKKVSMSWVLDMTMMGKGMLWVNGVCIGRFWDVVCTRRRNGFLKGSPIVQDEGERMTQSFYHVPSWVVDEGDDAVLQVVAFVESGSVGKIRLLEVR